MPSTRPSLSLSGPSAAVTTTSGHQEGATTERAHGETMVQHVRRKEIGNRDHFSAAS